MHGAAAAQWELPPFSGLVKRHNGLLLNQLSLPRHPSSPFLWILWTTLVLLMRDFDPKYQRGENLAQYLLYQKLREFRKPSENQLASFEATLSEGGVICDSPGLTKLICGNVCPFFLWNMCLKYSKPTKTLKDCTPLQQLRQPDRGELNKAIRRVSVHHPAGCHEDTSHPV